MKKILEYVSTNFPACLDTLANLPQLLFFIQPDPADPAAPPVKGKFLGSLFGENNFQDVTPFLWKS